MLQIITGIDRVFLSEYVRESFHQAVREQQEGLVFIVPEQFSYETEHQLCLICGETLSRWGEVLSFSRISDRVSAAHGGVAKTYLDHGGRLLAMALAAEQCASRIRLYGAVLRRPEFLEQLVQMAEEFQSYCLEPSALLERAARQEGTFAQKLEELALLYESYLSVCQQGQADPAEKLTLLAHRLSDTGWAVGRSFFVDGFTDFTGAELAVLEQLMTDGRDVTVCLAVGETETAMTRPARSTVRELQRLAESREVPCQITHLTGRARRCLGVQTMLDRLFAQGKAAQVQPEGIRLRSFEDLEEECRHGALAVKELAASGVRWRDIHVACAEPQRYEAPLKAAFQSAGVPVYFSGETDVLGKPVLGAVLHALKTAAGTMLYEDAAVYLKSGLPLPERDRCDRLDAYGYLWNLRGSQWDKPLSFHPQGFAARWNEEDHQALALLEQTRQEAMGPLLTLRKKLKEAANTGDMVLALHGFLEALQLSRRLQEQADGHLAQGRGQLAQELGQLYEILISSMEQVYLVLGQTVRTPEDFSRLYRLLLTQYQVGTIPAGLDQVHISSIADLRQRKVRHLLVLGAADGSFPSYRTAEGLLTEEERRCLLDSGLSLAPCRADQMDREMASIHSALSAAQESLWLSYTGEQPAWLMRKAAELCPGAVRHVTEPAVTDLPTLAARRLRDGEDAVTELEQQLLERKNYEFTPLSRETVEGLYGKKISLSASRIDKYASCRFAFFLAYGLKAKPRKQAQLDPAAFGTLVHEVLEKTVLRVRDLGGFRQVEEETLLQIAVEEIERYAAANFPEQAERAAWLFRRSREEILTVVRDLGEELRKSLFEPECCELDFAPGGTLPAVEVTGEYATGVISGFVDRVDLYKTEDTDFVRVVDYKTGRKDFDYTDILNGLGLQMLIYLFALRKYGDRLGLEAVAPAGVLYLPARQDYLLTDPDTDDETIDAMHRKARRRKGLILGSEQVLAAMEEDPDHPRFMPYEVTKQGLRGDLADHGQMERLERFVFRKLAEITDGIAQGNLTPDPIIRGMYAPCRYCEYRTACHEGLCRHEERPMAATSAAAFWEKLEEEEVRHG